MTEHEPDAKRRRLVESVIPKIIKRAVERGVERAQDAPADVKSFITDMRLPKELAHYLLAQVDETKNGLFRVVAHEMRDFLEETNFSGELQKLLTTVQFEVNTTIRFTPNENKKSGEEPAEAEAQKLGKPEVKTEVHVRREERERRRAERMREREARRAERKRQREAEAATTKPSSIPPPPRVPEGTDPDGAPEEDPGEG